MDLSDFETVNDDEETVYKQRPETKTQADLDRVISKNKPQAVVDKFAAMVATGDQWNWFDLAVAYADELTAVEEYNLDLPVIGQDEETDEDIIAQPKELPIEPVRPAQRTVEDVLSGNIDGYLKIKGLPIAGHTISISESNQNGIAAIKGGIELAAKYEQNIFPVNFKAETESGSTIIVLADLNAFEMFALEFMAARQSFFN